MPKYSIVIPTFNHSQLIRRCLDSLITQTFEDWEAIIVNNFSSDDTLKVIHSYNECRFHVINFKNNGIIAASRNQGILNSCGEWICFLDSDDWWYPNKLEEVNKYTEYYDVIYHDLQIERADKKNGKIIRARDLSSPVYIDLLIGWNGIPNSSCVVRASLLNFSMALSEDQRLVTVEDFDLWLNLAKKTEKFYRVPLVLGAYWSYPQSAGQSSFKLIERLMYLFIKHASDLSFKSRMKSSGACSYQVARIYQKLGENRKAFGFYLRALFSFNSLYQAKAAIRLGILVLRVLFLWDLIKKVVLVFKK